MELYRKRFGRFRFDFPPWTKESPLTIGKQARGTAFWARSTHNVDEKLNLVSIWENKP